MGDDIAAMFEELFAEQTEAEIAEQLLVAAEPAAEPVAEPVAEPILVLQFGCGMYGGPWSTLVEFSEADATALLAGEKKGDGRTKLLCRATTKVLGEYYTLVVFGVRASRTPEEGLLDSVKFRKVLGRYRGKAGVNVATEKFVVRQTIRGVPVSYHTNREDDIFRSVANLHF